MKKLIVFVLAFVGLFLRQESTNAQCNNDAVISACQSKLADGFTFLKSYSLDKSKTIDGKTEFPYVFSKETQYNVESCGVEGEIEIAILDSKRKELFNSTDKKSKKTSSKLSFKCSATDVYYIIFTLKSTKESACGAGVLSFKR
jgi:hypothetical protein